MQCNTIHTIPKYYQMKDKIEYIQCNTDNAMQNTMETTIHTAQYKIQGRIQYKIQDDTFNARWKFQCNTKYS